MEHKLFFVFLELGKVQASKLHFIPVPWTSLRMSPGGGRWPQDTWEVGGEVAKQQDSDSAYPLSSPRNPVVTSLHSQEGPGSTADLDV